MWQCTANPKMVLKNSVAEICRAKKCQWLKETEGVNDGKSPGLHPPQTPRQN